MALVRLWNWKSAVLSALVRGSIFFAVNLQAGPRAALGAFMTELALRAITAGFYGALTQSFRRVEPVWVASLTAMLLLPLLAHSIELLVHYWRHTPNLLSSVMASAAFTVLSTQFNLFAMRRGALIVGQDSQPLSRDLRRVPGLIARFVASGVLGLARLIGSGSPRAAGGRTPVPQED